MTTFPATVLLATDGSAHATNARRAAAEISVTSGAALHLVHAWRRRSGPLSLPHTGDATRVANLLERERDLLAEAGVEVAAVHAPEGGWPAVQILAVARGIGADLVVAGSRHLGWLERQLSAPTSEGLLRLTTVPVLVVRDEPGAWPPARVLVGDDRSRTARDAAVLAAHLGQTLGRFVEIIEVVDPDIVDAPEPTAVMARVLVGIDQRAAAIEEEAGTRLWGSFRFQRSPTAGLDEVATRAGRPVLLVVGHRSARRRTADASPSVAGRLLQDGHASLLICPSGALAAIRRRRGVRVTGVRR